MTTKLTIREPINFTLAGHLFDEIKEDESGKQYILCKYCDKIEYIECMKECDLQKIKYIYDL